MQSTEEPSIWANSQATIRLAAPLLVGQVAVVALGLIDTVTLSRIGTDALGGGGLGIAVFSLVQIICIGVLTSVGNEVSFLHGSGRTQKIAGTVCAGFVIAVVLGCASVVLTTLSGPTLVMLGESGLTAKLASSYLVFATLGIIPNLVFNCLRNLMVGLAKPGPTVKVTMYAVALKGLLNTAVILLLAGVPTEHRAILGVRLCGITSTLTYVFMASIMWTSCRRRVSPHLTFRLQPEVWTSEVVALLRLGTPVGLSYGVEAGLFTGISLIVGRFGEIALAAHYVANQCAYLTFMLAVGLSHAVSVRVGIAAGAGDLHEARRLSRQAILMGLIAMTATATLFALFGHVIAAGLVGADAQHREKVVELATRLLFVAACFQWADGTQNIAMGALRGLKRSKVAMFAAVFGYWVIGLPLAWFLSLPMHLGPVGAWCGLGLGLGGAALALVACLEVVTREHRGHRLLQPSRRF